MLKERNKLQEILHQVKWWITGIVRKISRVFQYIPVVWNNEDWDYYYLFILLKYKLSRMRKAQEQDTWHSNSHVYAKQIKQCEYLLDRLAKDEYLFPLLDEHEKRWGKQDCWFTPVQDNDDYSTIHFKREKAVFEYDVKQERKEYMKLIKHSDYLKKQDMDYFCKLLNKYSFHWWT